MLNFRDIKCKARVVNVDKKDTYSLVKMKSTRKDKKTDQWVNSTWSFVRFLSTAQEYIDQIISKLDELDKFENGDAKGAGVPILIKSLSLENASYIDKDGNKAYAKNYKMVVWDWIFPEDDVESNPDETPRVEDEEEKSSDNDLPF
jgi:hypothetical protein